MPKPFLAIILTAVIVSASLPAAAQSQQRTYQSYRAGVSIDGGPIELVTSVGGGGVYADVVVDGSGLFPTKRPGQVYHEPVVFNVPVSSAFAQQLARSFLQGNFNRNNFTVTFAGLSSNIVWRLEANSAMITELQLSACDASSKEGGYFTFVVAPDAPQRTKPGGTLAAGGTKSAPWTVNSFRLEIDGIDCTRVSRIESLTVKLPQPDDTAGTFRSYEKSPTTLETPTLRVTFSAASRKSWEDWFDDFIIRGKNSQSDEKNGSLTLLGPNQQALAVINLYNIGIVRLEDAPAPAGKDGIFRVVAEMYVERVELAQPGGAVATAPPPPTPQSPAGDTDKPAEEMAEKPQDSAEPATGEGDVEAYRLQPNPRLTGGNGRLVLRLPEQTRNRSAQRLEIREGPELRSPSALTGNVAQELPPGEYLISINGRTLKVLVEAATDTMLQVGLVRVDAPENIGWHVLEDDFDNTRPFAQSLGGQELALPPGDYFVRINREIKPITVKVGELTEISPP